MSKVRDTEKDKVCTQHPETCSDPNCEKHN